MLNTISNVTTNLNNFTIWERKVSKYVFFYHKYILIDFTVQNQMLEFIFSKRILESTCLPILALCKENIKLKVNTTSKNNIGAPKIIFFLKYFNNSIYFLLFNMFLAIFLLLLSLQLLLFLSLKLHKQKVKKSKVKSNNHYRT